MSNKGFKITDEDDVYLSRLHLFNKKQFDVIHAFYAADHATSLIEVATYLGIPVGTVKSRMNRGVAKIVQWRADDATKETLDEV